MRELCRQVLGAYLEQLWGRHQELVDAMVRDGWPREMARVGLELHRATWRAEELTRAVEAELSVVGRAADRQVIWPERLHHIWPALPGAGLTPVLVGVLLGIEQAVRASSRGQELARVLSEGAPWRLLDQEADWRDADVVVVSGADDTVRAVRQKMDGRGRVVGYGHRVSIGLVLDDPLGAVELEEIAKKMALDVVMWHQRGCFSLRGVLFYGSEARRLQFCEALASKIAEWEGAWGIDGAALDAGDLAHRAQALGMAQMAGPVWCEGVGFVREISGPFSGGREALHSVTVHPVEGPDGVAKALAVEPSSLQGVAVAGAWGEDRDGWLRALATAGATRIAAAGELQAPPPGWWHDGQPNALSWARFMTID